MFKNLLNPPAISDYQDYFKTLLTVSGVLLGLAFTALIFVIQSGFASFKFSRRMFLEQYVVFGQNLLATLSYLTLIPLGELYLGAHRKFLSAIYCIFSVMFIKTFLDIYKQRGYMHTLFSTKFVPGHYGRFRSYFRYIRNLGFLHVVFLLLYLAAFLLYPVAISFYERHSPILTTKGLFYSTLILLTFSIVQIANFIPHFFKLSNMEIDGRTQSASLTESDQAPNIDYVKEKAALATYLADHGLEELKNEIDFLDGTLFVNFLDHTNTHEAWFNVNIRVVNSSVFEVRSTVLDYAFRIFRLLRDSLVDINSFVLSFHIQLGGERSTRNIFLRSTRLELNEILSNASSPQSAIMRLKNKLFDEMFRDLDNS
jgi:hypothetical protein